MEKNSMIEVLESYFRSKYVKIFLENYDRLTLQNLKSHYINSFGINFKDGKIVSVKFYVHTYSDLIKEDVLKFLPISDDYFKFLMYKKKRSERFEVSNLGVVMELKFKEGQENPVKGFFYNLENSENCYNQIGFPESLPKEFQKKCMAVGINFEYENENILFKRYYCFDQEAEINYFAKRFAIDLKEAKMVEYAESINNSKINIIPKNRDILNIQSTINAYTVNEEALINYLVKKFGLDSSVQGVYENNATKAVYFYDSPHNKTDSEYLYTNTIQKVIDNL